MKTAVREESEGFAVYVLVEDDAEVIKNANKKLDELLQCFWVCFYDSAVSLVKWLILDRLKITLQEQLS